MLMRHCARELVDVGRNLSRDAFPEHAHYAGICLGDLRSAHQEHSRNRLSIVGNMMRQVSQRFWFADDQMGVAILGIHKFPPWPKRLASEIRAHLPIPFATACAAPYRCR